ncbi:MAG: hypothetical protein KAT68_07755 [Bacteroidales bacterium]|nr:hypothetical protein [Bacteroidales bacterium]
MVVFIVILTGCSNEFELQKSVFISDTEYPDLPKYSEWGYNTFGAYYDREVFVSNNKEVPMKVVVTNDTTSFIFQGQKGASEYIDYNNEMSMKFSITDFLPNDYTDLILLNDTIIDLENSDCRVLITINVTSYEATILNGKLEFKRVQKLLVDTKQVEVILSGLFEFQALINDMPISVTNGRFDVGIGKNNFFSY